jgi:serine/threonine protein kinase
MTATAVILSSGEKLGGYRILEVLGIGGMAVVYRAEQLSLQREVALKVLSPELGRDEVFSERFRREGMHVARLDHPNIIPIYDAGADKSRLYLAMRLVDGMTLAERMRADALSAEETLGILGPIADGLDCAHATGLVHRDIKPQNILLTHRGHPYLADFGVAKHVETAGLTASGGFVGSFHYAAPEQVLGTATSPATDVYALAGVLYQCLTGTVPYAEFTDAGVLYAHVNSPAPELPQSAPLPVKAVIERGMAKNPAARYATAGELIEAARHSLSGLPAEIVPRRPTFIGTRDQERDLHRAATFNTDLITEPRPGERTHDSRSDTVAGSSARARWITTFAVGLALVAGALTAVLLSGGSPAVASSHLARSGALAISYREPWARTQTAFAAGALAAPQGRGSSAPIELASGEASLAAGTLVRSAPIPAGPPPELVARFGHTALKAAALANGSRVALYRWTLNGGRTLESWVIPTTAADLAIICSAPVAMVGSLRSCAEMALRAQVGGASLLAVGPDVRLARSVAEAVAVAGRVGRTLAHMYRAGGRPSAAPLSVARADARAAGDLEKLDSPPRFEQIVSRLRAAFAAEARALTALAHAAATSDRNSYATASSAVQSAGRELSAAGRQATSAALLASIPPTLRVPALPARTSAPQSSTPSSAAPVVPVSPAGAATGASSQTHTAQRPVVGGGGPTQSSQGATGASGANPTITTSPQPIH